jgi:ankyrin repeat protein
LLECAWDGDFDNAKYLIDRGRSVYMSANQATTPLIAACRIGSVPLAELFLEHGATCRELDEGKRGPLLTAVMEGKAEVCRVLLEHRCNPNVTDEASWLTALHYAASRCDTGVTLALLSAHANPASKDKSGRTPRDIAQESGATEAVDLLSKATDRGERRSGR